MVKLKRKTVKIRDSVALQATIYINPELYLT